MITAKVFGRPPSGRAALYICSGLLGLFALMSYSAILQKSPTWDEPLHVTGGYLIRWLGDHRVDPEDPAFFQWLTTIPQSRSDLGIHEDPSLNLIYKDRNLQFVYMVNQLFRTPMSESQTGGEPAIYSGSAYINRARAVFTVIGIVLGALLARLSYRIAGTWAAILATLLFAFDPNFLAHSSIVKNDVPMALALLWLIFAAWRFGRHGTWRALLSIVLACAVAVNLKFSGVLFFAILAALLGVRAMLPQSWDVLGMKLGKRLPRLWAAAGVCVLAILISWGAIWACYGFRYSVSPEPDLHFNRADLVQLLQEREMFQREYARGERDKFDAPLFPPPLPVRTLLWIDDHHLLPNAWSIGLLYTYQSTLMRGTFLMDKVSVMGQWYYFPCAMLFKTPLAVLVLALILPARFLLRKSRPETSNSESRWIMLCLWIPIAIYGFSAMTSNLAIGLRHVLPLYPLIYALMAAALARWIGQGRGAAILLTSVLLLGLIVESALAWPNYIPFFNAACGGSRGGLSLLGDSNLDWGQDLPLLAQWREDHPADRLYLAYFGSVDPAYYGIIYDNVADGYAFSALPVEHMDKAGVLAISATDLQGIYATPQMREGLSRLRQRTPLAVLGGSIYLYQWRPADAAAVARQLSQ